MSNPTVVINTAQFTVTTNPNTATVKTTPATVAIVSAAVQGPPGPTGSTGAGVVAGGTTGQVLQKNSNTDFDTSWVTIAVGGVTSFNTRTGAITLTSSDVTTALGYSDIARTGVANTFTAGPQTVVIDADGNRGVVVQAHSATQSVPLQEWQKSTGTVLFSVGMDGSGNPVLTTGVAGANFFLQGSGTQDLVLRSWATIQAQSPLTFGADLTTWNAAAVHYARFTVPSGLGAGLDYLQAFTAGGTASTGGIHLSGSGNAIAFGGASGSPDTFLWRASSGTLQTDSHLALNDAKNLSFGTSTGTKIGTATSQKMSLWNATPVVQPTTAVAAAAFVANASGITNDTATFDGYTIGQVVKALRSIGALA